MNAYLVSTIAVPMITYILRTMGNCRKMVHQIQKDQFLKIRIIDHSGCCEINSIPHSLKTIDVLTMRNIERLIYSNTDFPYTFYLLQGIPFYVEVINLTSKGEMISRIVNSQMILRYASLITFPLLTSKQLEKEPDARKYVQVSLKTSQNKEFDITEYINRYRLCAKSEIKLKTILNTCPEYSKPESVKYISIDDLEEITLQPDETNLGDLFSEPNLSSGRNGFP